MLDLLRPQNIELARRLVETKTLVEVYQGYQIVQHVTIAMDPLTREFYRVVYKYRPSTGTESLHTADLLPNNYIGDKA